MAIRMRYNKDEKSVCLECGETRGRVLEMYDIMIAGIETTICDECSSKLMNKVLKAECSKNGRLKTKSDLAIISRRMSRIAINSESHLSINEASKDM